MALIYVFVNWVKEIMYVSGYAYCVLNVELTSQSPGALRYL